MRRALHFSGQGKEDKTRTETFLLSCKIQQKAFQKKIGEWYQEKVLVEEWKEKCKKERKKEKKKKERKKERKKGRNKDWRKGRSNSQLERWKEEEHWVIYKKEIINERKKVIKIKKKKEINK